jgi:hypothetical protein
MRPLRAHCLLLAILPSSLQLDADVLNRYLDSDHQWGGKRWRRRCRCIDQEEEEVGGFGFANPARLLQTMPSYQSQLELAPNATLLLYTCSRVACVLVLVETVVRHCVGSERGNARRQEEEEDVRRGGYDINNLRNYIQMVESSG